MAAKPIPSASLSALQSVANTLLAVLAPTTSRLVRVAVVCDEREDTAYTDGNLIIALPTSFCGCPLPEDAAVSVGLLAHEAGHFVQPLAAIRRVEEEDGAPHWLSNILLDVHGEAFVETVFPALAGPLQATRQAVHKTLADRYRQDLVAAPTFLEAAAPAALLARFAHPSLVFHPKWTQETAWQQQPWLAEVALFLDLMAQAARLPALALPDHLRTILRRFPALSHTLLPLLPAYGSTRADSLGRVLLGEAALGGQGASPGGSARLVSRRFSSAAPEAEAVRLARSLQSRFAAGPAAVEVAAPARIDRHALARGEPLPFRMRLPGKALPAAKVVLCLDISGSMSGTKLTTARVAGQAIALAVQREGGEVVGVLFSEDAFFADATPPSRPLFAPLSEWRPMGGTTFGFLPQVWRRWPEHRVLLLTDGYATPPATLPADRSRTAAVLILDGDPAAVAPMAGQAVRLADLKDLPHLLGMLVPRRLA